MRRVLLSCGAVVVGALAYRIGAQAMATPIDELISLSGTAPAEPRLDPPPSPEVPLRIRSAGGPDILVTVTRDNVPVPSFGIDCFRTDQATTCYVEEGSDCAYGTTTGTTLELALEPFAVVTGSIPAGAHVRYVHGDYSALAATDHGRFRVAIFRGPGTVTIEDPQGRVLITHPVIGRPGAQIDLGTVTID